MAEALGRERVRRAELVLELLARQEQTSVSSDGLVSGSPVDFPPA
jgi:hypothetical protein